MLKKTETSLGERLATQPTDLADIVRERIETHYAELCVAAEAYVWKFGLGGSRADVQRVAEDVLHEALTRVLQKAETYDHERPFRSWALGFVWNVLREQKGRTIADQRNQVTLSSHSNDDTSTNDLIARLMDPVAARASGLMELLESVTPSDRALLIARYVDQQSAREIAAAHGIPTEGAARVRVSRALANLRAVYDAAAGA